MFNSILEEVTQTTSSLSVSGALICIATSVALGLVIAFTHRITSKYSKNFLITLCVLPLLVQIVIMMVNGNLGTSIAVLGAFSLVKFRSIAGNSKEIVSIFWAMAIGLAVAMGQIIFAIVVTVIVALLIIILSKTKFGEKDEEKILKITIPENLDYTEIFNEIFEKYMQSQVLKKTKTTNMGTMYELTYYVKLKNNLKEKDLIDEVRCRNGNLNVSLNRQELAQEEL